MVKKTGMADENYSYSLEEALEFFPYKNVETLRRKCRKKEIEAEYYGGRIGYRIKGSVINDFLRKCGGQ